MPIFIWNQSRSDGSLIKINTNSMAGEFDWGMKRSQDCRKRALEARGTPNAERRTPNAER
jgi:hypothetical protein